MILDFSKLPMNGGGYEQPELLLQTLGGDALGTIPGVHNLTFKIKFVEQSEMEFDIPSALDDGTVNPLYESVTAYKMIYTKSYGIYVTEKPKVTSDGVKDVKHVTAKSLEVLLGTKKFFLEEGVYKFCNITNVRDTSTIIGRVLEIDPTWNIGYVSSAITSKYGAFEQFDGELYDFMMNNAMQKYRCVFVFDPYGTPEKPGKTISVYDADEERPSLPIYLGFDNLLKEADVEELSDELRTAIRPYGADELSIHDVNPTGDDWVYDLSGFIARGDLSGALAEKFTAWQKRLLNNKAYYSALTAARASMWSRYYVETAKYNALQLELDGLLTQQNAAIQGQHASALPSLANQVSAKRAQMQTQQGVIDAVLANKARIQTAIDAMVNGSGSTLGLSLRAAFTDDEYKRLLPYIIQQDVTDDTFVVSDIATDMTPEVHALSGATVSITDAAISRVTLTTGYPCTMYSITGGTVAVSNVVADIIRGTLEVDNDNTFTLTLYTGKITVGNASSESGIITVAGAMNGGVSSNISTRNVNGVTTYGGTRLSFRTRSTSLYLSASAGEFQRWAVEEELYRYAVELLDDFAVPTYQFTVQSGNFLFAREFAPFRNDLELGKGIYLSLPHEKVITSYLVEIDLNFERADEFSILFSNRFKRRDMVQTLRDMIEQSYSTSRSLDLSKHTYNTAASEATDAAKFIRESLDFAANRIKSAANQSVVIDQAGIQIGEASNPRQMRIVNDMLAITDDGWQSAKLAIGYFQNASGTNYFGVNAEVIAGNLVVGTELNITTSKGHFKVDNNGVYINSMKFYITNDSNKSLDSEFDDIKDYTDDQIGSVRDTIEETEDTIREFYNSGYLDSTKLKGVISAQMAQMKSSSGNVLFDSDGIWLMDGSTKETTTRAVWMNENGILFGTGSKTSDPGTSSAWTWTTAINHNGIVAEAIAAGTVSGLKLYGGELHIGKRSDGTYNFNVDSSGNLTANSGTFKGTVHGATFRDADGNLMMQNGKWKDDYIDSLTANKITAGTIDAKKVTIKNLVVGSNVTMGPNAYISWDNVTDHQALDDDIASAKSAGTNAEKIAKQIANGTYDGGTFISGTSIYSPNIYANVFTVTPRYSDNTMGGFVIKGYDTFRQLQTRFKVEYYIVPDYGQPMVEISGGDNYTSVGDATWNFNDTYVRGQVRFQDKVVFYGGTEGIDVTARFG
jgi:hypothetical protein